MPKSLVLGNGNMLLCFDDKAQIRDWYYHYVGLENHMGDGLVNKVGVLVDGAFSWLNDPSWMVDIRYQNQTMVGEAKAVNDKLSLELVFTDICYNEKNIFVRKVEVKNKKESERNVKIFFNLQFQLSGSNTGNTAFYDHEEHALIHYKGRRVFLASGKVNGEFFTEFSVGKFWPDSELGTWKDAEDGHLTGNPIEHGLVDSVYSLEASVAANDSCTMYTWITVGKSLDKVKELQRYVNEKSADYLIESTRDFWKAWINKRTFSFYGLEASAIDLFRKSLHIIRTHVDNTGAILASGDSDMLQYGRDTYSYVWPRDGSFISLALTKAGYADLSKKFFEYCCDTISKDGYFYHKYRPDKSLGSSWHPYYKDGKTQLPIQEDETALVLYSLWKYYESTKDLEFVEALYNPLIKKAANFMDSFRDNETGLPLPSYDLWEMYYGVTTFTSSAVYAGLMAASRFAKLLGKENDDETFISAAGSVREAVKKYLFNQDNSYYLKMIYPDGNIDQTVDSSGFYGVHKFGILDAGDDYLQKSFEVLNEKLYVKGEIGGLARFEEDVYYRDTSDFPGNPWIITTLWRAQYLLSKAKTEKDLDSVKETLNWVVRHATAAGILSEQIHPLTGRQLSAAPLIWSHAEYVTTLIMYLERLEELGVCEACYSGVS